MSEEQNTSELLRLEIQRILAGHPQNALGYNQLLQALKLRGSGKTLLDQILRQMLGAGELIKERRSRYGLPSRLGYLTGTLQGNSRGFAFLISDLPNDDDVYIRARQLKGAAHGDRVLVRLQTGDRGAGRRREGEVQAILSRGCDELVGTLERSGKSCFVIPDERRLCWQVQVLAGELGRAKSGEKVVVKISRWPSGGEQPRGRIIECFGAAGSPGAEQRALWHKFDLPGDFPQAVLRELEQLPGEEAIAVIAEEQGRQDLRDLFMVTIDGDQAKDFDDAVSLEVTAAGNYRLGVHIADVSHYVREGSKLDRGALERATSIYLSDTVIPMLPPLLSEQLCSLQAGRDRLAFSVLIELNQEGELLSHSFFPSLITVNHRLTYRQVEACLESTLPPQPCEEDLDRRLRQMDHLAVQLKRRRLQRGTLDLNLPEAEIILDLDGNPVDIQLRNMGRSESLIEEFMILCNEVVAAHLTEEKIPTIYRVHAVPAIEKLTALREMLLTMNYTLEGDLERIKPRQLSDLLEKSRGKSEERLIRYLLLRSLPQARYSSANEGHFGLASRYYTHFTSPIRRYPDLEVHRILKEHFYRGKLAPERLQKLAFRLPSIAAQSSERERAAMEAERASEDLKKVQYMQSRLGEEYPGIISGVTNFGLFVELENTVEGMIPIGDLTDDYYVYHERRAALVGERRRKVYRLGEPVVVRVVRAGLNEGKITFGLVEGPPAPQKTRERHT